MISKVAIQAGLGVTAVGGVAGAVTYALWDSTVEYLVEVKTEATETIKTGNKKNYACQWTNTALKKDEDCKLIKIDFGNNDEKKSINLTQITHQNTEVVADDIKTAKTWIKLKISKDYEFKVENSPEIQVVQKDSTNTIFTTLIPKFKISTPTIEGKSDTFLVKLTEKTTEKSITGTSFECALINEEQVTTIKNSWTSSLTDTNTIGGLSTCKVYKFGTNGITEKWKIEGFNLKDSSEIQASTTTDIETSTPGPYYIINFISSTNTKFISESSNLMAVVAAGTDKKPVGIFSIKSTLAGEIKTPFADSKFIVLW